MRYIQARQILVHSCVYDNAESLNSSSIRLPPARASGSLSAAELNIELQRLFDTVDVSHDGSLSSEEIKTLLAMEQLDSSDETARG